MIRHGVGGVALALAVCGGTAGADAGVPSTMTATVRPVAVGDRPHVKVHVPAPPEGAASGEVRLVVQRMSGSYTARQTKSWNGEDVVLVTRRVGQAGKYVLQARFVSGSPDVRDQVTSRTFRVSR
ncbi:hypothetical protein [Nocardioides aquiterrae]